jgi:hypothetical protein
LSQDARNVLYFIYLQFKTLENEGGDVNDAINLLLTKASLLEFIAFTLNFHCGRFDTYSEIFKEQATGILI